MTPWPLWQRRRIADLQADGLPLELAMQIGKAETVKRQRISRIIGWRAARAAVTDFLVTGDQVRVVIIGGLEGIPASQRERLLALPNMSAMITP
jgi:hypothetical protein